MTGRDPLIYRPTWAEIDLRRLKSNLRRLKRVAAPRGPRTPSGGPKDGRKRKGAARRGDVMFVVKADAYGHGAVETSLAAEASGAAKWLGVSCVEEGVALREAGITRPILILGSLFPFESTLAAIRYDLVPTVASLEGARLIVRAAAALERLEPPERRPSSRVGLSGGGAGKGAGPLSCHLKIDTGMGRIGVRWPAADVIDYLRGAPGVRLDGVYTHLARAEDDAAYTRRQLRSFREAVRGIERMGVRLRYRHAANSAGALRFAESRWDMIRPGLAAYGLYGDFEPVMSLKTRIVFLKNVGAGTSISYGRHFRTRRRSRIATLPVGYGDGLPRLLSVGSGRASVLIRGRRCPIVGAVTMDMTMVDVTGLPGVHVGDEAVLIGRSGSEEITAAQLAAVASTIPYEIVTGLKARVPRVYLR